MHIRPVDYALSSNDNKVLLFFFAFFFPSFPSFVLFLLPVVLAFFDDDVGSDSAAASRSSTSPGSPRIFRLKFEDDFDLLLVLVFEDDENDKEWVGSLVFFVGLMLLFCSSSSSFGSGRGGRPFSIWNETRRNDKVERKKGERYRIEQAVNDTNREGTCLSALHSPPPSL